MHFGSTGGGGSTGTGLGGTGHGGQGGTTGTFVTSSGVGDPLSGTSVVGAGGYILGGGGAAAATNPLITHAVCGIGQCSDFPATPILDTGVPSNAPSLFTGTTFTGSLCLLEPQLSANGQEGAMIPANWVRPRFHIAPTTGIDLFEIRIHSEAEKNDLLVYTTQTSYYLPKSIWEGPAGDATDGGLAAGNGFANNAAGAPVTVTIRGVNSTSPGTPVGITGDFNIAPVIATGSMVFWTVNSAAVTPQSSQLFGFAVGDEGVADAVTLPEIKWTGEIGEDGSVLRGYYDSPKLAGFVDGQVRCMGCHTTMPDGSGVIFTDDWPWSKVAAGIGTNAGNVPSYLGAGAQAMMKTPWWGTQTMSPAHFKTGDRILVSSYATSFLKGEARTMAWQGLPTYNPNDYASVHQLAWIDLESTANIPDTVTDTPKYPVPVGETQAAAAKGTAWGLIATGDTGLSDVSPSLSHDGNNIVYVATDYSPDGHPDAQAKVATVRTVAYNNKAGGTSAPLTGASSANYLQYYPSYSADDKLIAFIQAPLPTGTATAPDGPYYNRFGQEMVVPAGGGTPTSLAANMPNACAGDDTSAGIINSWPKWSPDVVDAYGKTYYFLIFSSGRKYADEFSQQFQLPANAASDFTGLHSSSQLYLAAVVVDDATGAITTYPAVYIWNQNRSPAAGGTSASLQYSNLTPAWDAIALPPIVIPPPEMTQ